MAVEDDEDGEPTVDIEETAPTVDGIEDIEAAPSEPVDEPASGPVSKPIGEPVRAPVAEPVVELFAEPASEPFAESSAESSVESAPEPTKPLAHSRVRLIAFA